MRYDNASPGVGYGWAVITTALATGIRFLLDPALGDQFPFVPYVLAVLITAWIGGIGPALASAAFGGLAATYFFLPPRNSLYIGAWEHRIGLAFFVVTAFTVALIGGAMRAACRQAEERAAAAVRDREQLRVTIESFTALAHELQSSLESMHSALQAMPRPDGDVASARARELMERQMRQLTRLVDELDGAGENAAIKASDKNRESIGRPSSASLSESAGR
jgi:K+-sensing histidine kinase KdpD